MCQSVTKKLSTEGSLSTSSSKLGNDGAAVEKRIRKTPEFALGQTFQENGRAYGKHGTPEDPGGMSSFLMDSGILLNDLATSHVQYEIGVEKLVLQSLTGIVDDHGKIIVKKFKTIIKRWSEAESFSRFESHDYLLFCSNFCLFLAQKLIHNYPLFYIDFCLFLAPKFIHDYPLFAPSFAFF